MHQHDRVRCTSRHTSVGQATGTVPVTEWAEQPVMSRVDVLRPCAYARAVLHRGPRPAESVPPGNSSKRQTLGLTSNLLSHKHQARHSEPVFPQAFHHVPMSRKFENHWKILKDRPHTVNKSLGDSFTGTSFSPLMPHLHAR